MVLFVYEEVKQVSNAVLHSMILLADGTVRCYGGEAMGISGVPARVGEVKQIACAIDSMVLLADGTVRCWGSNEKGQCDVPSDLGEVKQIVAGVPSPCQLWRLAIRVLHNTHSGFTAI